MEVLRRALVAVLVTAVIVLDIKMWLLFFQYCLKIWQPPVKKVLRNNGATWWDSVNKKRPTIAKVITRKCIIVKKWNKKNKRSRLVKANKRSVSPLHIVELQAVLSLVHNSECATV